MKITKRSQLPKYLKPFKLLKGISVGKCVNKNYAISDDHVAHTHCFEKDPFYGWICLRFKYQLKEKLTLLHEMAHIIANTSPNIPYHGKLWKQALTKIGGTFKAFSYTHNGITRFNLDYTYRNNKI